ncbi:late embryogenesis abundant protein At1g64065-like [Gastrolobium bilobum]|uniref:late embryogenesis abundant protein At1g64065-like n=1 Tax=Gastrolobium bilobum TaxID=150636 RepID=UPI002AAFAEA4|nr:late embryogenesis abundant protein At1g64065-like [Gastrolobium bilobum]
MAQSQREQVKPLAPFIPSSHFSIQEHQQNINSEHQIIRIRKFVRCCGCVTALVLIFVVIIIVLAFTVYNVQDPEVRMNGVTLLNGTLANGATNNITLVADVSVKNKNAFTFRFGNTTTSVYYDGTGIGEGTTPPGKAKARRTMRFNVTMEIMAKKLLANPSLKSDLIIDQALNISSYTMIDGKVKILNMFKRKVVVELNCTIQYNITTGLVTHGDNCLGIVDI